MRSHALVAGLLGLATLAAGSSYAAQAAPRSPSSIVSDRAATWDLSGGHTTSTRWRYVGIPGHVDALSGFDIRSRGRYEIRVRTHLSGGRMLLRVVDNGKAIAPRSRAFAPTGREHTFFFTGSGPKRACGHLLRIEWRSASGRPVTLHAGRIAVHYQQAPHDAGACA
jgi:hypothetical protein